MRNLLIIIAVLTAITTSYFCGCAVVYSAAIDAEAAHYNPKKLGIVWGPENQETEMRLIVQQAILQCKLRDPKGIPVGEQTDVCNFVKWEAKR